VQAGAWEPAVNRGKSRCRGKTGEAAQAETGEVCDGVGGRSQESWSPDTRDDMARLMGLDT
jgi:hypothetical protein